MSRRHKKHCCKPCCQPVISPACFGGTPRLSRTLLVGVVLIILATKLTGQNRNINTNFINVNKDNFDEPEIEL